MKRETFGSRLGFILVSAGCAVGIGNVWKFPYMCGQFGGAAFILIYLVFLLIMGIPVMVCEFGVGRASRHSVAAAYETLEPKGTKWHITKWIGVIGCYFLMMFYTTVGGWMLYYCVRSFRGDFVGADMVSLFDVKLRFKRTLCGTSKFSRYRVLGKIQIEEPGVGRHPRRQRNNLEMFLIHIRYLLLDTVTGYRSQYHGLSAIGSLA